MRIPHLSLLRFYCLNWLHAESGIASLHVGLLIAGPLVVASAISAAMVGAGKVSTDQFSDAAYSAVRRSSSGIELRGPVIARTDGERLTFVLLDVGTTVGEWPVQLGPSDEDERTVVRYIDDRAIANDVPYSVDWITGDGDDLLETGEMAQIIVDLRRVRTSGGTFTIEVRPPEGLYVSARRTLPAGEPLDRVISLY